MCLTIPHKIIKIKNNKAFLENGKSANLKLMPAKVGDYAFVKNGFVINTLDKVEAETTLSLINNAIKK